MDLLFPDAGLVYQLTQILTPGVRYHLFANNFVPTLGSPLSAFTEAAWSGYANVLQNWASYAINGVSSHSGFAIAPPITFNNSSGAPVNAYGYYVTDTTNTVLLAAALFDSPPVVIPAGGNTVVIPVWGDFSQLSA